MDKLRKLFLKAMIAGLLIGLAGSIYLSLYLSYKVIGAMLFSFALLLICAQGLSLYTGKVGYIIDNKPSYLLDILVIILGNLLGTLLIALAVRVAKIEPLLSNAQTLMDVKLDKTWYQILALSFLCGMMMYLAVESYRRVDNHMLKVIAVIFAVMIFILAGFEHSIADLFYFFIVPGFKLKALLYMGIMIVGNGLGAVTLNLLDKGAGLKA